MAYYNPADVMRRKADAALTAETVDQIDRVKVAGQGLYDLLASFPGSADMTLAKRKVEEAVMWAVKAVTA